MPGIRFFWDSDGAVSRLYGAIPTDAEPAKAPVPARRFWIVLDPTLRVLLVIPFAMASLWPPRKAAVFFAGIETPAPILFLPHVFEQEFSRHLIGLYKAHGGQESGVTRVVEGKTVVVQDHIFKRRKDYTIKITPLGMILS